MQEYVYPAIFHSNDDGTFTITYPDLPGCISEGKSLGNAMFMAQAALTQWIEYLTDKKQPVPPASDLTSIQADKGEATMPSDARSVYQNGWTTRWRNPA